MPAYVIVRYRNIKSQEELDSYRPLAWEATTPTNAKPLAIHSAFRCVEGVAPVAVVLIEFPSMEEATQWYESEAYQKAVVHRLAGADCDTVIVDGWVRPGP